MRQVIAELEKVRRRSRAMLVVQRLAVLVAWVAGLILGLVALDYLLRLPDTARLVLLVAGAGGLVYGVWTYLLPAVQFRPGLTQLALRAEGAFPAVKGRLASSVEFAVEGIDKQNPLAARSVRETESRLSGEALTRVISGERTWRAAAAMLGVLAVVTTTGLIDQTAARIGLARLFVPYGAATWPARTGVESLMAEVVGDMWVHPRGQALLLKARVTKGQPHYVGARYRLQTDGRYGPWQRIVLTHQAEGVHERLVDTTADALEVFFETEDARTPRQEILLAAPPAVRRATLRVTPPPYAATWFGPVEADLGTGLDERAVTDTPSLVGSDAVLSLQLNKPIPAPRSEEEIRAALGWDDGDPPACAVDPRDPRLWTVRWRLAGTRALDLDLVDEYGLRNAESIAFRIEAVEDRLPGVTIMEPESDEPVLASAVVSLAAEARDDVAVAAVGLEATTEDRASLGGDTVPLWETSEASGSAAAALSAELDLAALELSEGDVVIVHGTAEDVFELDGQRHPAVRSPARRLRIISALELARLFRRELGAVRQNAIRIEARQSELEDDVIADGPQPGIERGQAQVGERIAMQREVIERVLGRVQMNRLDDEQLKGLVRQTGELLDFAGRAANRATEAIERRQREGGGTNSETAEAGRVVRDDGGTEPAPEDRAIVEAQEEVRQELADLITLLDRDEDTWVATRRLEELLEAQTALETQTGDVGRRTLGRSWEELTPGEQSELERMARRQSDLADTGRKVIDDLRRRAEELESVDPMGASSMRQAADSGDQRELNRDMENAAQRVGQNQMRTARAAQESARRTLQQMLQNMRETRRADAQELLRRLASLIESIQRLITVQEAEIDALARAMDGGSFSGRDLAMIRLNQNTQTVAEEARTAGQESRRVARVLDRAADAQGAVVVALRAEPVAADGAMAAENRSLELLREARDLAQELEQAVEARETMRQREELVARYRVLEERQVSVRDDTLELVEQRELDRRQLIEARGLGRQQEEIRQGLDELAASTREIQDSPIFLRVHDMMDDWSAWATDALISGEVSVAVSDRQQRVADSIGRLIKALEDLIQEPGEFAGGGGQQGGSGQGQQQGRPPLIPPMAELMLLRGMQEQVYNETRNLDARRDLEAGDRQERLEDLADDQQELLELGEEMAESLGNVPPAPEAPGEQDQP
jgi:hypothetical protein